MSLTYFLYLCTQYKSILEPIPNSQPFYFCGCVQIQKASGSETGNLFVALFISALPIRVESYFLLNCNDWRRQDLQCLLQQLQCFCNWKRFCDYHRSRCFVTGRLDEVDIEINQFVSDLNKISSFNIIEWNLHPSDWLYPIRCGSKFQHLQWFKTDSMLRVENHHDFTIDRRNNLSDCRFDCDPFTQCFASEIASSTCVKG